MAGVKGRSGGPRPNSGGARPGAGRKKKEPAVNLSERLTTRDPVQWLEEFMVDAENDLKERKDAAKALLKHRQAMAEAAGKKEQKKDAAREVAGGRFRPQGAPTLRAVK